MSSPSIAHIKYHCTKCKAEIPRDSLTAKRIAFQTMGLGFRTIKSRVVDWLCDSCRDADPAWNTPKHAGSPGMKGTKLEVHG